MRSRQPQSASFLFGGEIRIKNLRHVLRRDAYPMILKQDPNVSAIGQGQAEGLPLAANRHDVSSDAYDAPSRHRLLRVDDQIIDDLAHLSLIHVHRGKIRRKREFASYIASPKNELGRLSQ